MKLFRVLGAMTLVALALFLSPSTAQAAYNDGGGGGKSGGVTVSPPSGGGGGPVTITVTGGKGDTRGCITVRNSSGAVVDQECGALGRNGKARFNVCLPAGTYTVTATDQSGNNLGTSQFRSRGCAQGGPASTGATTGGSLPNTGSSTGTMIGLVAGGALLIGGAGFVVASRKRQTA